MLPGFSVPRHQLLPRHWLCTPRGTVLPTTGATHVVSVPKGLGRKQISEGSGHAVRFQQLWSL